QPRLAWRRTRHGRQRRFRPARRRLLEAARSDRCQRPELYQDDIYQPYFERLRREDPVHFCEDSHFGPYWSVTRYKDIMAVAVNRQVFSSPGALGAVRREAQVKGYERPSFIQMDEPDHGE